MADTGQFLTGGTNSFQTTSAMLNKHWTNFYIDGVVGSFTNTSGVAPSTGALAVNAQGSPNMTVAVTGGDVLVTGTPTSQASQRLTATIATQNVTIAANATGGTRFDWVYVTFSASGGANPAADGTGVFTVTTSRSNSSSVDNGTPPTYGYCIAKVTVANGAVSITNGNIADNRTLAGVNALASTVNVSSTINLVTANSAGIKINGNDIASGWTAFTPSWTNITVGSGTNTGYYMQIGKTVHVRFHWVFGTGAAVGSSAYFTLPVTPRADVYTTSLNTIGTGVLHVAGNNYAALYMINTGFTSNIAQVVYTVQATGQVSGTSSTAPATWTTNDFIQGQLVYEAA